MRWLACCLTAALVFIHPLLEAQQPAPVPGTFGGSIDVHAVNVEAVVTDARGRRVSGLAAKDFHLRIDGRETPIDAFAEIGAGKPAAVTSASGAGPTGAPEAAAPPQGRSLLVFIDDAFSVKTHRDIVLQSLAGQLLQLDPADRVAVVAFDGRRMAELCGWTSDRATLAKVLAEAESRPAAGNAVVASRRRVEDDLEFEAEVQKALDADEGTPGEPDSSGAEHPVGSVLGNLVFRSLESPFGKMSTAISAAMRAFANAPGRKLMLLLSGGWPSIGMALPVAGEANRLGYTLYPVDVPGVDTTFLANSAFYAGPSPVGHTKDGWETNAEYTLELLARATGGKAAIDSARLDALPRALEDTRSYYWLSFTPRWAGDDRGHRIELKVGRAGLQVRSRRSFADFSPATRAKLGSEDVLFFGGNLADKRLGVLVGRPEAPSARSQQVPFLLAIPLTDFTAVQEGRTAVDLMLSVQTEDDAGARVPFPDTPVHVSAGTRQAGIPSPLAHFKVSLPLARHPQRLIFTLREPSSGTVIWGDARVAL
jgi:VWFA-related protein